MGNTISAGYIVVLFKFYAKLQELKIESSIKEILTEALQRNGLFVAHRSRKSEITAQKNLLEYALMITNHYLKTNKTLIL